MSDNKKDLKKVTEVKVEATQTAEVETKEKAAPVKIEKKAKKVVKKDKKPNIFLRIGKKLKEVFSELKKVTWPTFPTVLKQTGVVVAVVSFFLILIFAFDSLLAVFYEMLLS